ncbi:D-alanyl-D-alanine dipeptidase [Asanoa hainanensis]|uniref:D-alanyl-D-alanine dipeptidase n=1 Tax=Asanoa hainanensis TaxID=560556 RepID=A0A239PBA8_9ACTN|nr:M15 family metallopeptidase [Asanoa hainanensis]SNT64225.1 D-alanyl-D-alanine dipeptidase [Asanoa hainanensis]
MILISDPRVAAVPVFDNGEAMVDLRTVDELRVDDRLADPEGAFARLREGAVARLLAAQRALPAGLRLLVVEAYRPLRLQREYFGGYQDELRSRFPSWSEERVYVEASKYVSPPSVAPHSTGGTVDLTLAGPDGRELDMGTAVNDSPVASANACFTAATHIPASARRNRYVLGSALRSAGFANYPTEWWHWSYGDRYWALGTGASQTHYGPVDLG